MGQELCSSDEYSLTGVSHEKMEKSVKIEDGVSEGDKWPGMG